MTWVECSHRPVMPEALLGCSSRCSSGDLVRDIHLLGGPASTRNDVWVKLLPMMSAWYIHHRVMTEALLGCSSRYLQVWNTQVMTGVGNTPKVVALHMQTIMVPPYVVSSSQGKR